MKKKLKDLTGLKFGRLTVLEYAYTKKSRAYWLCQCECGNKKIIFGKDLRNGKIKSCGCLRKESILKAVTKHNKRFTKLYPIWVQIKQRCLNINNKNYRQYGERGISVCQEWLDDFMNFYNWAMANGYKEGLTIDRINTNGDYCPENCRWVDFIKQARNTRKNVFITYRGEKHCISEWAEILGIKAATLRYRALKGLDLCRP